VLAWVPVTRLPRHKIANILLVTTFISFKVIIVNVDVV
jgi:hypothetical protein